MLFIYEHFWVYIAQVRGFTVFFGVVLGGAGYLVIKRRFRIVVEPEHSNIHRDLSFSRLLFFYPLRTIRTNNLLLGRVGAGADCVHRVAAELIIEHLFAFVKGGIFFGYYGKVASMFPDADAFDMAGLGELVEKRELGEVETCAGYLAGVAC